MTRFSTIRRSAPAFGYTLLELIVASSLTASVLVTTLSLMRQGLDVGRRAEKARAMVTLGTSTLERQLAMAAASFSDTTLQGTFAAEGYPELRYEVVRSQQSSVGGIPNRLMAITATVWHDEDGDTLRDSDEASTLFSSKIAKMAQYQGVAGGS